MDTDVFLLWLLGMTLVAGIALGIWQYRRVRASQRRSGEMPGSTGHFGDRPGQSTGGPPR